MSKIALITDSPSDLTKVEIEKYNIHVLPLRVIYKDRDYADRVEITPEDVYKNLTTEVPTTSLPLVGDIEKLFIKLEEEGYTHAIGVFISSGLSGTFNGVKVISEQHPNIISHIYDSLSLSYGTGGLVLECAEMLADGKSFDEIVEALPSIKDRTTLYYVLDTLHYLIKGGRIGKVSGTIGEILNIKPIISVNKEGVYYTCAKVRGRKQSISKLIEIVKETLMQGKAKVWVLQGGALEEGKEFYESISKLPNITKLSFSDISPVSGVHTGPGLLGIAIVKEP